MSRLTTVPEVEEVVHAITAKARNKALVQIGQRVEQARNVLEREEILLARALDATVTYGTDFNHDANVVTFFDENGEEVHKALMRDAE